MAKTEGTGSAADAGAATSNTEEQDAQAVMDAQNETLMREAKQRVEGAQARIDRQKEHLDGAEEALKDAMAALASLKEGK